MEKTILAIDNLTDRTKNYKEKALKKLIKTNQQKKQDEIIDKSLVQNDGAQLEI